MLKFLTLVWNVLNFLYSLFKIVWTLALIWKRSSKIYRILKFCKIHRRVEWCHTYWIIRNINCKILILVMKVLFINILINKFLFIKLISDFSLHIGLSFLIIVLRSLIEILYLLMFFKIFIWWLCGIFRILIIILFIYILIIFSLTNLFKFLINFSHISHMFFVGFFIISILLLKLRNVIFVLFNINLCFISCLILPKESLHLFTFFFHYK